MDEQPDQPDVRSSSPRGNGQWTTSRARPTRTRPRAAWRVASVPLEASHHDILQLLHGMVGPVLVIDANLAQSLREDIVAQMMAFAIALPVIFDVFACH